MNSPERVIPKPLELRGHHLNRLRMLLNFYETTGSITEAVESTAACAQVAITQRPLEYQNDVMGYSSDERKAYWRRYKTLLRQILEIPNDQHVTIIQDRKDDICRLCVEGGGTHCENRGPWGISADKDVVWNRLGTSFVTELSINGKTTLPFGELKALLGNS